MASVTEKLADSQKVPESLQSQGVIAIRSRDMTRTHRERLLKAGFLKEVIKGRHIAPAPGQVADESTAWHASSRGFCAQCLSERFGTQDSHDIKA